MKFKIKEVDAMKPNAFTKSSLRLLLHLLENGKVQEAIEEIKRILTDL